MHYHAHTTAISHGDIFVCLPNGTPYIAQAYQAGAATHMHLSRREWALFAREITPVTLCVIGITGTNGKTSTAHALAQALTTLGYNPYVQGTLNSSLTTPDCLVTYQAMQQHEAAGGTHFIMEVSSHGIDQDRIYGIQFAIKALTTITPDHLDYHGSFAAYKQTKLRFIDSTDYPGKAITRYKNIIIKNPENTIMDDNRRLAKAILLALNIPEVQCDDALMHINWPSGRLERVAEKPLVVVDFAHTPDALKHALIATKHAVTGKCYVVFGCGGDRDQQKRPAMGQIASDYADYTIITTDNPRTEDPDAIAHAIIAGMKDSHWQHIPNRKQAIAAALSLATPTDAVLIAGKGHEAYQAIAGSIRPCDTDKAIVQAYYANA